MILFGTFSHWPHAQPSKRTRDLSKRPQMEPGVAIGARATGQQRADRDRLPGGGLGADWGSATLPVP